MLKSELQNEVTRDPRKSPDPTQSACCTRAAWWHVRHLQPASALARWPAPPVRATLQVTSTTAHRLFETAAGAAASFVAFCLPAARDSLQSAIAAIDDASFAAGTSTVQCFASVAGGELYLYGLGEGASAACKVYETLATAPKRPRVEEAADACSTASASAHQGEWQAVLLSGSLASGGEDHGIIEAALRGKTGLGPAAKPLNMQAVGGELYLVDAALLEQLDVLLGMQKKVRFEGVVEEGCGPDVHGLDLSPEGGARYTVA